MVNAKVPAWEISNWKSERPWKARLLHFPAESGLSTSLRVTLPKRSRQQTRPRRFFPLAAASGLAQPASGPAPKSEQRHSHPAPQQPSAEFLRQSSP